MTPDSALSAPGSWQRWNTLVCYAHITPLDVSRKYTSPRWHGTIRVRKMGRKKFDIIQVMFTGHFIFSTNFYSAPTHIKGFPGGSVVKNSPANADVGSIPGSTRSPGRGHGYPLQYSCPENFMDRGAWRPTAYSVRVRPDLVTNQQQIHTKHNSGVEVLAMKNRFILKVCLCVCFLCFLSFKYLY